MSDILLDYSPCIGLLMSYQWLLRMLSSSEAEYRTISRQIDEGLPSEDVHDPEWKRKISCEQQKIREKLRTAQQIIADIPDSPELIPCKLFLKDHYILGMSLTRTAAEMGVSVSTIRRIKDRCFHYFSDMDIPQTRDND